MSAPEKLYTRPALKKLFLEHSGIPEWLLVRCQKEGADLGETLARCWPVEGAGLSTEIEEGLPGVEDPARVVELWNQCNTPERIRLNHRLLGHVPEKKEATVADPNAPRKEIQAELMYALLSGEPEYSFGLLRGIETVVFTRFTVSDPELSTQLLAYIEKNTTEKKGPVRVVAPGFVGKISYTGISVSTRHKSGLKVEHPRLESLFPPGGLWRADAFRDL